MTRAEEKHFLNKYFSPELSFEISESGMYLDDIIKMVERNYTGWKFSRTEARNQSCVMAVFERR